ncbi:MAG: serine/threonine-protein kinase [Bythopirellula sp.]
MVRADRSILEQAGLASNLLTEEQIDHAWQHLVEALPASDLSLEEINDEQLAEYLVELGYINVWQAEQLCQGRTKFTLGSYRIVDAIGHGGMGWVFKGEHELLGRIEAIKVLPKTQMNPTSIANFRREIRAQAQLDHPNLVRLSYADKDGDTYFLVTEFVPGSDLRRLVHYHGAMTQQKAAILISQAAEALDHAHGQGMIHRDVKPGNILITPAGHAKLTDLGLAFFAADQDDFSQSKPKHIVGTADFLAPEIIVTPSEVKSISDIYSLGCTLYYAVTGKVPFPGGDTADKLRRQLEEMPISPKRLNAEVDDEFADVIAAMMQKRPDDRIATATEVVERLRPWTPPVESTSWQEIKDVLEEQRRDHYANASLAETIPASHDSEDTDRREPARLLNDSQGVPALTPSAKDDDSGFEALSRSTTALVAVAVTIATLAISLVLSSL